MIREYNFLLPLPKRKIINSQGSWWHIEIIFRQQSLTIMLFLNRLNAKKTSVLFLTDSNICIASLFAIKLLSRSVIPKGKPIL